MSSDSQGWASRVFDLCVGILLAAMALYGAVQVVRAVWVPLCLTILVVVVLGLAAWFFVARFRRY